MKNYTSDISDIPFTGGAIGYISYDLGNEYEHINTNNIEPDIPLLAFGIYDWAIIVDHFSKNTILLYENEDSIIKDIKKHLENSSFDKYKPNSYSIDSECKSNLSYDEYKKRFKT